ncbi:MAG: LptF/LptG family permease [Prevotella sp.]|nr:LptF/LptG family permease [Prevotella sp.]
MFRIKKLDVFIAKQFLLLFAGTFFICQFVLMMQFLWRYVDDLIGKGLSLTVLAQFFWYMGLMLLPQALPLAILLSSLIAFGNLGESSELTAIKAAGISLMQTMRSLVVITLIITGVSFYFQDVIGPEANKSFGQLLLSMKQKSPELEIPEGVFYDGLPNSNIYVQKKNLDTGKLYGIMIYRQNGNFDDHAIILADSGMLQSTEEKKHLLLTLYSGEWFENMRSQDIAGSASVPYRRETFGTKRIVLDFDGDFNLADVSGIAASAKAKSIRRIYHDLDSIREYNDSVAHAFFSDAQYSAFRKPPIEKKDSLKAVALAVKKTTDFDSLYSKLSTEEKQRIVKLATDNARNTQMDLEVKSEYSRLLNRNERLHSLEALGKITLALSCIIFFFIGAPLGAIIRKGGLGVPVIISVIVFIVFYIFDNTGFRMAREDEWTVWFGRWLGTAVLTPIAVFFTYKANNDSVVFNIDLYKNIIMRMLGLRLKRNLTRKEVIIEDPDYAKNRAQLVEINSEIDRYIREHKLLKWPNPIKVFFRPGDDHDIAEINERLEETVENLSYTKDSVILNELNNIPIIATHAHTRPFVRKWLNIITGIILPLGLFFYIRMLRFRFRLYRDLKNMRQASDAIIARIDAAHTAL